jgi:hypothetical protein
MKAARKTLDTDIALGGIARWLTPFAAWRDFSETYIRMVRPDSKSFQRSWRPFLYTLSG